MRGNLLVSLSLNLIIAACTSTGKRTSRSSKKRMDIFCGRFMMACLAVYSTKLLLGKYSMLLQIYHNNLLLSKKAPGNQHI